MGRIKLQGVTCTDFLVPCLGTQWMVAVHCWRKVSPLLCSAQMIVQENKVISAWLWRGQAGWCQAITLFQSAPRFGGCPSGEPISASTPDPPQLISSAHLHPLHLWMSVQPGALGFDVCGLRAKGTMDPRSQSICICLKEWGSLAERINTHSHLSVSLPPWSLGTQMPSASP